RDFVYVTDVAEAFLAAAREPISGERFNVGAGNPQSINRLVELLGGDVVYVPKRPGEPDCTFANISKIVSQLSWKPTISFEEGVRRGAGGQRWWRSGSVVGSSRDGGGDKILFSFPGKAGCLRGVHAQFV